jgi:hypothetical protein
MGLFTGFFSSKMREQPSGTKDVAILTGAGNFELGITGDAQYQAALEAICGPRRPYGVNRFENASLIWEDKNPHGKNAVRVEIRRKRVGYLSREVAILFREQLKATGMAKANGQCQAVIRGGWVSSDGRKGPYCVWLDLPISYQCHPPRPAGIPSRVT